MHSLKNGDVVVQGWFFIDSWWKNILVLQNLLHAHYSHPKVNNGCEEDLGSKIFIAPLLHSPYLPHLHHEFSAFNVHCLYSTVSGVLHILQSICVLYLNICIPSSLPSRFVLSALITLVLKCSILIPHTKKRGVTRAMMRKTPHWLLLLLDKFAFFMEIWCMKKVWLLLLIKFTPWTNSRSSPLCS